MGNTSRVVLDLQIDDFDAGEPLLGDANGLRGGRVSGNRGSPGPLARGAGLSQVSDPFAKGLEGGCGTGRSDEESAITPYPANARSSLPMQGVTPNPKGWLLQCSKSGALQIGRPPVGVMNQYPTVSPLILAVAVDATQGGCAHSDQASETSRPGRRQRAAAARPAMSGMKALGMNGLGSDFASAHAFAGISGVDAAEEAMAMIAKSAKEKLRSISQRLKAVSDQLAATAGQQGGGAQGAAGGQSGANAGAQKALEGEKDQLMLEVQIAMAEWSQATQAQTNLRSKNDKTLDAIVGNLR